MRAMIAVYILAMVVANLLVWKLGPWFSPINSFLLIGLDLTLRDVMHDRLQRWQMFLMICAGGAITYGLNPAAAHIATASAVAFAAAALVDWLAFEKLKGQKWLIRCNGSNVAGAVVDSVIFPLMAFGAFLPLVMLLQFVAKVSGGAVWSLLVNRINRNVI